MSQKDKGTQARGETELHVDRLSETASADHSRNSGRRQTYLLTQELRLNSYGPSLVPAVTIIGISLYSSRYAINPGRRLMGSAAMIVGATGAGRHPC